MPKPSPWLMFRLVFCATFLSFSASCFAALGGDVSSVQADQSHMRAQRRVTQNSAYSVHEMQADTGTVVREFVSPAGKVFGVSWQGAVRPDMQQVLGSYFAEFAQAIPAHRARGPVTIRTANLVIYSGGHMRALTGHIYIPDMVPGDVRPEDIK
jgi:hypothetical protein